MKHRNDFARVIQHNFNSPTPVKIWEDPERWIKAQRNKPASKRAGTVIWNNGTFMGNVQRDLMRNRKN